MNKSYYADLDPSVRKQLHKASVAKRKENKERKLKESLLTPEANLDKKIKISDVGIRRLKDEGWMEEDIGKMLNTSKQNVNNSLKRTKMYSVKELEMAKLAFDRTKDILENKPKMDTVVNKKTGEAKEVAVYPDFSNILKAVEIVVDRTEPKITKTENLNANINLDPIDLSKYKDD